MAETDRRTALGMMVTVGLRGVSVGNVARTRRRLIAGVVALVLVLALGGAAWLRWHHAAPHSAPAGQLAVDDPEPRVDEAGTVVGAAGATARFDNGVRVDVPAGAVAADSQIVIRSGPALGEHAGEIFGQPIGVTHDQPLRQALTLRWRVPSLSARQLATAVLARWNPDLRVWEVVGPRLSVEGDTLTAEVSDFSFWDWIANVGQSTGELTGKRVNAPTCGDKALHAWVRQTVDPDEDTTAAAIRVCFEPDRDEIVTARVANNRTFSQRLSLTPKTDGWAWTWAGREDFGPTATVYSAARTVFDSDTTYLMPPLTEIAVGLGRPTTPGQSMLTATATVDVVTVLMDVGAYVFDSIPIGGLDNPLANALLQALFECGGKQLLNHSASGGIDAVVRTVVDAVGSCATEIVRGDSEFGARFEALTRQAIQDHSGLSAASAAKANRLVHQLANAYAVLKVADLAFYVSDQLANAMVGPLALSIRGDGRPQRLGVWQPSCRDLATDSDRLFRNLALQDAFADKSKELWQFPTWGSAAAKAVAPLADCDDAYLSRLADFLPGDWADAKAAGVVAGKIRALTGVAALPDAKRLRALGCQTACEITGKVNFTHPSWGPSLLLTTLSTDENSLDAHIFVLDAQGNLRWQHWGGPWYELATNAPAQDKTGHIFINYNPGRLNGVIILSPVANGFADFASLPEPGDYQSRFYSASVADTNHDGTFEVDSALNDCDPDCAGGTIHHTTYRWNGTTYAAG